MSALVQLPPPNVPVLDARNMMTEPWYRFFGSLVTRAGGVTGALQPEDPTLTALAALSAAPGVLVQTAADTFVKRLGVSGTKTPPASVTLQNGVVTAWS